MSSNLTVVLVHRDEAERKQIRHALEALSGVQLAGERPDLRAGLALARQARPQILIIELGASPEESLQAAAQFKLEQPETAIFLATDALDPDLLLRALRGGAQEVLRRPLDRVALREAVERVAHQHARKTGAGTSRGVITVFSAKGGVGVTTIATNLAVSLRALTGRSTALADFDHHSGDAAFALGLTPARSLADVLAAPRIDSASIQDALLRHETGISVLSQPEQLDRVEGVTGTQLGAMVEILAGTHDYVVVDAPHMINDLTLEVFDRSSTILLVCEASIPSVRAARRSLEIFHRLNFMVTLDRVRLVVNRRSETSSISLAQLEETLAMPIAGSISNDYAVVSHATNVGKPLVADRHPNRPARDLIALARTLVPEEAIDASLPVLAPPKNEGFRLFRKRKVA